MCCVSEEEEKEMKYLITLLDNDRLYIEADNVQTTTRGLYFYDKIQGKRWYSSWTPKDKCFVAAGQWKHVVST